MTIDIKDVIDYCWCPRYYTLKKKDPNRYNLKTLYDNSIHTCFYKYLTALQNDILVNPIDFLKYWWGKIWIKPKRNSELVCTPSATKRDSYDAKRKAGINALIIFDELMQEKQCPIIINKTYEIQLTKNITLTGTWEYIREIEYEDSNIFQILKFRVENNRFNIPFCMDHDLELTAASYAFKHIFNADHVQLLYMDIYAQRIQSTVRAEEDYKLLKQTVISVVKCINNNISCVSPDKKCFHCEYRNLCETTLKKGIL